MFSSFKCTGSAKQTTCSPDMGERKIESISRFYTRLDVSSLPCRLLACNWSIFQPHKSSCFGAFPEAQLWVKERSLHLQRTIHSCQKLAVCGTQRTAAVFPEYWQLLWQPVSFTSTGISEALLKKLSMPYACISISVVLFHFYCFVFHDLVNYFSNVRKL